MIDALDAYKNSLFFSDQGVLDRHYQLETTVGALDIEKESYQRAQIFSWIFYPIWILLAFVQAICFVLSNGKLHPLAKIIEDFEDDNEGKFAVNHNIPKGVGQLSALLVI